MHMHVCVLWQLIREKVVHAHSARILGDSTRQNGFAEKVCIEVGQWTL